MNNKHIKYKGQIYNEEQTTEKRIKNRRIFNETIKKDNYLSTKRGINTLRIENIDNRQINKNKLRKILIPYVIILGTVIIVIIILIIIYFFLPVIIPPKKNIKISTSDFDYKKAESIIGLESVKSNYIILNETLNNINDLLLLYKNVDIKQINTEINYTIPTFLENPTSGALRIVKTDIEFYKDKYEKLSEKSNNLTEIANKSINNIYISLNRSKNEIEKLFYQFKEMIKNLSIPFILKEKIFDDTIRNLDEKENNHIDEEQLEIINQLEEYKNNIDELNSLYYGYFNYINENVINDSYKINEIPNTVVDLQNKIEEGKNNFAKKTNNFLNPNDIQSLHSELISIKNDFISIKNETTKKQNLYLRREYRNRRTSKSNDDFDEIKTKCDEKNNNITQKYQIVVNGMSKHIEKKTGDKVEIPELYGSNIIFDSIEESLNLTVYTIKNEEKIIYNELEELNDENNVEERTSLDLLFIMDITGSMNPYLTQVKNSIINIINRTILECPGIDINMGYIGYTDHKYFEHNVNIEFTNDYLDLQNTIKNVTTWSYNPDFPEDVAWGMEMALEKNWKSNTRFAILLADAPCHGYKYHSSDLYDEYPDGDPTRTDIEELAFEFMILN